jgi:flagellar hook-associated protein 3 FlgL
MENLNETLTRLNRQISSGKKLNQLMDSPADSAEMISLNEQASEVDQYQSNINTVSFFLKSADSALNEVHNLVTSIYTQGTQSASDVISSDNRAAIAAETRTLRDQILSLANTQVRGRYLFAGSNVLSTPFDKSGDVVSYHGNDSINGVSVDDGMEISESVSGATAFNSAFSAITALLTAMDGNDVSSIRTALGQFSSALSDLGAARAQVGSSLGALGTITTNLNSKGISLTERKSKLEDTDMATAVIQLSQSQAALQAAISAGGSILSQNDLFDILG